MLVIAYVSLKPIDRSGGPPSVAMENIQNFAHIPAYAILTFCLVRCFFQLNTLTELYCFGIAFAYGVIMELLQHFVPGRFTSGMDVLRNTVGIAAMIYTLHKGYLRSFLKT